MILGIAASVGGGREKLSMTATHLTGGAVGGAAAALLAWTLATPIRSSAPDVLVAALALGWALLAIAADLKRIRLPRRNCQVPQKWYRRYGPTRGYFYYGAALGAGLITYIPYGITYVVFGAAAVASSPLGAAAVGAAFGIGRTALIGPAALAAERASVWLFRGPFSHRVLPKLSIVLVLLLAAAVASDLT